MSAVKPKEVIEIDASQLVALRRRVEAGTLEPEDFATIDAVLESESGPTMECLREWLKRQIDERLVEPHSALGAAIQYLRNHWEKLTLFLRVPGAPLDNNICERALTKAILHRKNGFIQLMRTLFRAVDRA